MGFCCLVLSSVLLLGFPQAESPPFNPKCDDGEYLYSGICCLFCPAGSYVNEPCIKPHTQGLCQSCTEGEDYTAYRNGLNQCLPCNECQHGKRKVKPCTVKSNTICQCKDGYYCPPVCEECIKCTQKCPEGQVIVRKCNATADLKCGIPDEGSTDHTMIYIISFLITLFVILTVVFLVVCFFLRKKKRSVSKRDEGFKDALISDSKADVSTSEDRKGKANLGNSPSVSKHEFEIAESNLINMSEHPHAGTVPSAPPLPLPNDSAIPTGQSNGLKPNARCPEVIVKKPLRLSKLNDLYYEVRHIVPQRDWKMLMRRMGLSDNDIHKIIRDNDHADEQDYQMLKALQDRFGTEEALYKLLNGLWDMNLNRICENLYNELISNDIITLKNNGI